jgi:hypothetical protein
MESGAKSGAFNGNSDADDPDLGRLVAAWPGLEPAARRRILDLAGV